jgi:hypothetical protein
MPGHVTLVFGDGGTPEAELLAGDVVALARDFLAGKLEQARRTEQLAYGEVGPGPDVRALERVIALLEAM